MTQDELAARSGVRQPNIAAYETGARKPSDVMMRRLLDAARPRPSVALWAHRRDIARIAAQCHASNVRVFGSVARGDDDRDSDVDLVVTFDSTASLYDQAELVEALSDLLGHRVDVLSDRSLGRLQEAVSRDAVPL